MLSALRSVVPVRASDRDGGGAATAALGTAQLGFELRQTLKADFFVYPPRGSRGVAPRLALAAKLAEPLSANLAVMAAFPTGEGKPMPRAQIAEANGAERLQVRHGYLPSKDRAGKPPGLERRRTVQNGTAG